MKITRSIAVCLLAALGAALVPSSLSAQVSRLGETLPLWSEGGARGSDVAFDSKNNVYLVVSSFGTVRGRYLSADGVPLGDAFVIQASPYLSHFPRAAYSPDAAGGAGAFLVTWHASVTMAGTDVFSRIVSYSSGLGTESLLMPADSRWEAGAAVEYSTVSKEFLVVWQTYFADVRGVRVANTGVPIGTINVALTPAEGERDPNIAYNPATDEFLVVYSGWGAFAFVRAQRVKAGTGDMIGAPTHVTAATGTYITNVAYNSATGQYLSTWYQPGGHFGRLINADGSVQGDVQVLSTTYAAYDALGLAYNTTSGTFHTISHGPTAEAGGVEIGPAGTPLNTGTELTAIGGSGNFYPRMTSNTARAEWMMSVAHQFSVTIAQRFGSGTRYAAPGPSCTFTLVESGTSFNSLGGGQTLTVTASASDCAWTAISNASWLTVSSGAKTGTTTVSYQVAANTSFSARTGTLTLAGLTYTVSQNGQGLVRLRELARADFNADGASDLLWQDTTNGYLAVWTLSGHTVTSTRPLSHFVPNPDWRIAGTGDFDGDGKPDIVWHHRTQGWVYLWYMNGLTMFAEGYPSVNRVADTDWRIAAVGDMNGDQSPDLVWRHTTQGWLTVWLMHGRTVMSVRELSPNRVADPAWEISGMADFNLDGHNDLIWRNRDTGHLLAWVMNGLTQVFDVWLTPRVVADTNWEIVAIIDANGDTKPDLVWRNSSTGALIMWYMNGFYQVSDPTFGELIPTNWTIVGAK